MAGKHILVVNDTQEILEMFRALLEEEGYRVTLYTYKPHEIDFVREVMPDLIILDYMFGREGIGWQLLQKLRMDRELSAIPVVVCTTAVKKVRELEGHLKTMNVGVVIKPFDIQTLLDEVALKLSEGQNKPAS